MENPLMEGVDPRLVKVHHLIFRCSEVREQEEKRGWNVDERMAFANVEMKACRLHPRYRHPRLQL